MPLNNQKNLLQAPTAKQKGVQNEAAILQFLLEEKYSTARVLTVLLGFADRSSILKVLKRMIDKRWIKSHQLDRLTKLYGITQSGIHEAQRHCDVIADWKYFEPSKVNPNTLLHQLMVQEVHALCVWLGLPLPSFETKHPRKKFYLQNFCPLEVFLVMFYSVKAVR